mmetsp:Transcript_82456/g.145507  ORF Transcript_82456/g.145507 Transcript_82456/m.145507 type:complete len:98 (+) Transcript_82456:569-862(+)
MRWTQVRAGNVSPRSYSAGLVELRLDVRVPEMPAVSLRRQNVVTAPWAPEVSFVMSRWWCESLLTTTATTTAGHANSDSVMEITPLSERALSWFRDQ